MKKTKLIICAVLAACFGAPPGFRTANASAAVVDKQLADQAAEIERLKKQLEESASQGERISILEKQLIAAQATPAPQDTSTLSLLCKGAGVDPADVRWRIQAGLDEAQAVEAALAQKTADEAAKKGGK
jgi:hypothetical protein